MEKKAKTYQQIAGYSVLAFLFIPFPLLTLSHLVFAGFLSSSRKAPTVNEFISISAIFILSMILGCFLFWLRNKKNHDANFFKQTFKNVVLAIGLTILAFQAMPLPFATSTNHGAYRDDSGVYQWNLEHTNHWELFGGAKMTSGTVLHFARTADSKTPEFENNYRYAGDNFVLFAWLVSLGVAVGGVLILRRAK